jgi:hypothetical protein
MRPHFHTALPAAFAFVGSICAALRPYARFGVGLTVSNSRSDRCHKDAFT